MAYRKPLSDKQKLRDIFREAAGALPRAEPICRHFGECGGCEFQNIPYPAQLDMKRQAFRSVATEVSGDFRRKAAREENIERAEALRNKAALVEGRTAGLEPEIVASPLPYGYRQRMDYAFAFGNAGLRRANSHRRVIELEECPLLGEAGFAVFRKAVGLAREAGLESYDYLRHQGELRYFVVRQSRAGGILLSLITKSRAAGEKIMALLERLAGDGDIVSGHWLLAEGVGDTSFGESCGVAGNPCIIESMNGVKLGIGPNTFFQSNPAVAEKAYAAIVDFVPPGGIVFDMYSGVGSIALSVSGMAEKVLAAENVSDNVALARRYIRENGIANVELIEADAGAWLEKIAAFGGADKPDMVIVNPPRPGIGDTGMAAIRRLGPDRLAYLSCNPFSLLRDLAEILGEYALTNLTLYDMFPQTRHFETLALLERKHW